MVRSSEVLEGADPVSAGLRGAFGGDWSDWQMAGCEVGVGVDFGLWVLKAGEVSVGHLLTASLGHEGRPCLFLCHGFEAVVHVTCL